MSNVNYTLFFYHDNSSNDFTITIPTKIEDFEGTKNVSTKNGTTVNYDISRNDISNTIYEISVLVENIVSYANSVKFQKVTTISEGEVKVIKQVNSNNEFLLRLTENDTLIDRGGIVNLDIYGTETTLKITYEDSDYFDDGTSC